MLATELLAKYREKLKSKNVEDRYAALTFALQLPDICSSLEYNNDCTYKVEFDNMTVDNSKRRGEKSYKFWISKHFNYFWESFGGMIGSKVLADYCYCLRCALVHDGRLIGKEIKMFFVSDEGDIWWLDDIFIIDLCLFCNTMFDIAYEIFDKYKTEFFTFEDIVISNDVYKRIYTSAIEREFNFYKQRQDDLIDEDLYRKLRKIYCCIKRVDEDILKQVKKCINSGKRYKLKDNRIISLLKENDIDDDIIIKDSEGNLSININKKYYDMMNSINSEIEYYYNRNPLEVMDYINRIKTDTKIDILKLCERPIVVFVEKFGGNQQ